MVWNLPAGWADMDGPVLQLTWLHIGYLRVNLVLAGHLGRRDGAFDSEVLIDDEDHCEHPVKQPEGTRKHDVVTVFRPRIVTTSAQYAAVE